MCRSGSCISGGLERRADVGKKTIKIFSPHMEIRIFVTDEMLEDYKECGKMAEESRFEHTKDCETCSWNNIKLPETELCACALDQVDTLVKGLEE